MPYLTREPGTQRMQPLGIVAHANVSPRVRSPCASPAKIHLKTTTIECCPLRSTMNISPRIGMICYNRQWRSASTQPESA